MKRRIALFVLAAFAAIAADVHLAWDPHPEPVKFRLYYGTESGTYTQSIEAGTNLTATVTGLAAGKTWYFAATAYTDDAESDFSNEVTYTPPLTPPGGLRVDVVVTVTVGPTPLNTYIP